MRRDANGHPAPGFTLIEVLIGVLILALALLGLGAVIPVVVNSQRRASDSVHGVIGANAGVAYLANRDDFNRLLDPSSQPAPALPRRAGWGVWLLNPQWSPLTGPDAFLWDPPTTPGEFDAVTGALTLDHLGDPAVLSVADRLWPARNASTQDPQFVWDLVARRVPVAPNEAMKIQFALFVRRIDPGIRVAPGFSLYDVLTNNPLNTPPFAALRSPVAVSSQGVPTNTGMDENANRNYALPFTFGVIYNPAKPDRLLLNTSTGTATQRTLARQVGQKWVDNLGNVYTVVGHDPNDTTGNTILISPSVPPSTPTTGPTQLRQIVLTPQIPARVSVFTLTPLDPK